MLLLCDMVFTVIKWLASGSRRYFQSILRFIPCARRVTSTALLPRPCASITSVVLVCYVPPDERPCVPLAFTGAENCALRQRRIRRESRDRQVLCRRNLRKPFDNPIKLNPGIACCASVSAGRVCVIRRPLMMFFFNDLKPALNALPTTKRMKFSRTRCGVISICRLLVMAVSAVSPLRTL